MLFRHSCILLKQSLPVEGGQTGKISPKSRRQPQQSQVVRLLQKENHITQDTQLYDCIFYF